MPAAMRWAFLGQVEYREALDLQLRLRDAVAEGKTPDTLLLLEHPPVITLGRSADDVAHVLISEEERRRRGVDLIRVGRGGDVTYHGPGQLVGYPVRRIGRGVRAHVEGMAEAIRDVLARLSIDSWWHADRPGVWTQRGKVAAVGVDARGGVAMHGFALNVTTSADDFSMIVPCGLQARVTSIGALLEGEPPALGELASHMAQALGVRYGVDLALVSATEVRS